MEKHPTIDELIDAKVEAKVRELLGQYLQSPSDMRITVIMNNY